VHEIEPALRGDDDQVLAVTDDAVGPHGEGADHAERDPGARALVAQPRESAVQILLVHGVALERLEEAGGAGRDVRVGHG
jgi:hypothetical protein